MSWTTCKRTPLAIEVRMLLPMGKLIRVRVNVFNFNQRTYSSRRDVAIINVCGGNMCEIAQIINIIIMRRRMFHRRCKLQISWQCMALVLIPCVVAFTAYFSLIFFFWHFSLTLLRPYRLWCLRTRILLCARDDVRCGLWQTCCEHQLSSQQSMRLLIIKHPISR